MFPMGRLYALAHYVRQQTDRPGRTANTGYPVLAARDVVQLALARHAKSTMNLQR